MTTAQRWCIITCEYPPMVGGVSDHTKLLAERLAESGDVVDVWTPPLGSAPPTVPGVSVHQLPSFFGLDSIRMLRRVFAAQSRDTRILVQYVPTGYGWRMMNVPFAMLLYSQRERGLDIYFHEVGFRFTQEKRLRRKVAAVVHVVMNWLSVRGAARVFVAIHEWRRRLQRLGVRWRQAERTVTWVPVPSNVPVTAAPERVNELRSRLLAGRDAKIVGHFGTFGRYHTAVVGPAFAQVLDDAPDRIALLFGRNSLAMRRNILAVRPDLESRVIATGGLEPAEISTHIAACDVLLQPYEDGVSARRGSLMAALALGRPVISNLGSVTGDVWFQRPIVHLVKSDSAEALAGGVALLLGDEAQREQLSRAARAVYNETFAVDCGVALLQGAVPEAMRPRAVRPARPAVRVLMLHTTLPTPGRKPGGVEIAVHRLANALVALGVPVTVASLSERPDDARYAFRQLFHGMEWLRESRLGRLMVLPWLMNGLRVKDANVVHFHGDDWFVFRRPRTTVRTLHGSALREAQRATRWQRKFVQYAVFPLERLAARMATVSVAVGRDAAHIHGITRVIGNGVDPSIFHPGEKSDTPTVLYVGTWDGRKRGKWMYDLFVNTIAARHPTVRLHFLSDGEPPAHPRVVFDRFPSDEALARAYREAWVFTLPSTYEGFGIPYLEAMASGTAVVATPNTGAEELLDNGRYGILTSDDAFADTVLELLHNTAQRESFAAAGLARASSYSWEHVAESYEGLYREALVMHGDAPETG